MTSIARLPAALIGCGLGVQAVADADDAPAAAGSLPVDGPLGSANL